MKRFALGVIAAGALFTATAVPALAQVGVYAGPGGFSIGIGAPGYYGGPGPYYGGGYYNYAPGWEPGGAWHGHPGWHHYHHAAGPHR